MSRTRDEVNKIRDWIDAAGEQLDGNTAELVEVRGLIQQTNSALAELRADLESVAKVLNSRTEHLA